MWPFNRKIKKTARELGIQDLGPVKENPSSELSEEYGPEGLRICREIQAHWICGFTRLRVGRRIRDGVLVHWCPRCKISDTMPRKKRT